MPTDPILAFGRRQTKGQKEALNPIKGAQREATLRSRGRGCVLLRFQLPQSESQRCERLSPSGSGELTPAGKGMTPATDTGIFRGLSL